MQGCRSLEQVSILARGKQNMRVETREMFVRWRLTCLSSKDEAHVIQSSIMRTPMSLRTYHSDSTVREYVRVARNRDVQQ